MSLVKNLKTTYKYTGFHGVMSKILYKFSNGYKQYLKNENIPTYVEMVEQLESFTYQPLISIITPLYKPNTIELVAYFDALLDKNPYQNIELCLTNDGTNDEQLDYLISKYIQKYPNKIIYQIENENSGIAVASNISLACASGEYIALIDQDDVIAPHAFFEYIKVLQKIKYDFIYSDEDMINNKGERFNPHFKSDWAPHTLLSRMYINHLSMYKKSILDNINGFRSKFDGTQDYDLLLRASSYFKEVYHVDKILYHWRTSDTSIASDINNKSYIYERAQQAIIDNLHTKGYHANVIAHNKLLIYDVAIQPLNKNELISVIVPFKNNFEITKVAIESLITYNPSSNLEIILMDNQSNENEIMLYKRWLITLDAEIKLFHCNYDFNYSKINNDAMKYAQGSYLLFLNNDIEFIQQHSVRDMLGIAQLSYSGAVGCTLLYPDDTIQHAGVILGYHEVAGHSGVSQTKDNPGYYGRNISLVNYAAVTAACLMIEKKKFVEANKFNEELAIAYNDVDLCLKLLQLGYFNVNVGNVQLKHHESLTRGYDALNNIRYQQECQHMAEYWKLFLVRDPFYNKYLSRNVGELYQIKRDGRK